jgi:hypothetical protein
MAAKRVIFRRTGLGFLDLAAEPTLAQTSAARRREIEPSDRRAPRIAQVHKWHVAACATSHRMGSREKPVREWWHHSNVLSQFG